MAILTTKSVPVICRKCGKPSPSDELSLDPVFKMMVCRKCIQERRLQTNPINTGTTASSTVSAAKPRFPSSPVTNSPVSSAPVQAARPSPFSASRPSAQPSPGARPMPSSSSQAPKPMPRIPASKSKKKCSKCSYPYTYDPERDYPKSCPNCGTPASTRFF